MLDIEVEEEDGTIKSRHADVIILEAIKVVT
jgi:hypothetical protein